MSRKTRKLMWSVPLIAVLAVAGALAMFVALGPGSVFANPLPAVPMNVEANPASGNAGRTTLVVTWDAVADATGYRIDISDDSFVWETLVTEDDLHTATTYTDNTLTASDVRWYRVFAINDHGEGPVSDPADGMTSVKGKPGPVRDFAATAMGQRQINLTWDPPTDNGGELISGYEIQFHDGVNWVGLRQTEDDRTRTNFLVVIEKARMDDGGHQDKDTTEISLDPGEMRRYQIRAVNNDDPTTGVMADDRTDEKAPGTEDGWVRASTTTAVATPPTAPSGLTAVNTDENAIALYWFAPELMDNGGWPVTDYLIQVRRADDNWPDIPDADGLKELQAVLKDAGAITADGANFRVSLDQTYTAIQKTFASVPDTWDDDGDESATPPVLPADQTPQEPLWLEFRVFSLTTDDGDNDTDDGADAATDDDTLIIGSSASETTARVRAVARVLSDADADDQTNDADAYGAPRLEATGSSDNSPATDGEAMEELIELTVARPIGVGKQNVYRIDYSDDAEETWKLQTRRTTFTGFDGNRRYQDHSVGYDASRTYRVFTLRSDWRTTAGPASTAVTGMTTASEAPGKVTGVMASAPDLETIEASWTAPSDDGGQPIVKYLYQYVQDDGDDVPDASDWTTGNPNVDGDNPIPDGMTDDAATMAEIETTLVDNELYHIRVAAVHKDGADNDRPTGVDDSPAWSDVASFTSGEATAPNMAEGIASEMAKDGTGTITQRGVDVLWNEPSAGADVDHYVIERSMDMGTTWESPTTDAKESDSSQTAYTDPRHYVAGETLVYRVAAENGAGMSDWVMVYYPRDPADDHMHPPTTAALAAPTGVTATSDTDGEVTVMWMGGDNADRYIIIALERGSSPLVIEYVLAESDASEATITDLNSDASHLVIVLALKGTGADREIEYGIDTVTVQ